MNLLLIISNLIASKDKVEVNSTQSLSNTIQFVYHKIKGEIYDLNTTTYTLGKNIVTAIQKKKVIQVQALDVHELTPLTDIFILAIAPNIKQTQAMADEVESLLAETGHYPIHKEGYRTATWILLDYGQVIVHILEEENAQFYGLDRLWKDAKKIEYK